MSNSRTEISRQDVRDTMVAGSTTMPKIPVLVHLSGVIPPASGKRTYRETLTYLTNYLTSVAESISPLTNLLYKYIRHSGSTPPVKPFTAARRSPTANGLLWLSNRRGILMLSTRRSGTLIRFVRRFIYTGCGPPNEVKSTLQTVLEGISNGARRTSSLSFID